MADQYIDAPIEFDENALYNIGIARIQEYFPNWNPQPASLVEILLRSCASMAAVGAEVASEVPFDIFRAFGELAHVPPIDAEPAVATTVWTMVDAQGGYDIPQGTPVGLTLSTSGGDPVGFETVSDTVVPSGQQTVAIEIVATVPGANGSGLDTVVRADSLTFVAAVSINGVSQGGSDAELNDVYVDRLSEEFELWTTTPIRGPDFAVKAREIPGVYRCAAWENYNPADGTTDNDKYVALCPIDENGNAASAAVQQQVADLMESLREVNFVCPVVSPDYSVIDVTARLHVSDPSLEAQAISDATTALGNFLNQATWGMPTSGTGEIPVWENTPTVWYSKIVTTLENVGNVSYADQVTIGFHGGAMGTTDLAMPGAFPLPNPGTFTVTAVSP